MKKSDVLTWIAALRSGDYKQHRGTLCNTSDLETSNSFCCIGVAAKVLSLKAKLGLSPVTSEVCYYLKITHLQQTELVEMNDALEYSFPEIADWIETNILPNCKE